MRPSVSDCITSRKQKVTAHHAAIAEGFTLLGQLRVFWLQLLGSWAIPS